MTGGGNARRVEVVVGLLGCLSLVPGSGEWPECVAISVIAWGGTLGACVVFGGEGSEKRRLGTHSYSEGREG